MFAGEIHRKSNEIYSITCIFQAEGPTSTSGPELRGEGKKTAWLKRFQKNFFISGAEARGRKKKPSLD